MKNKRASGMTGAVTGGKISGKINGKVSGKERRRGTNGAKMLSKKSSLPTVAFATALPALLPVRAVRFFALPALPALTALPALPAVPTAIAASELPETLYFPPDPLPFVGMALACGAAGGLFRDLLIPIRHLFGKGGRNGKGGKCGAGGRNDKSKKNGKDDAIGRGDKTAKNRAGLSACVCDALFVCVTYAALFVCALNFAHGEVRWYDLVAAYGGFALYRRLLSRPLCRGLEMLCDTIERIGTKCLRLVFLPLALVERHLQIRAEKRARRAQKRKAQRRYQKEKRRMLCAAAKGFDLFWSAEKRREREPKSKSTGNVREERKI